MKDFDPSIKVISFSEFPEGIANVNLKIECKEADQISYYVLKICNPMFENWKFEKEYKLLKYLSKFTNIPVPKVLHVSGSKEILNYKYFISEYIPGKSLEEIEVELDLKSLTDIFSELGRYLTELHKIKFEKFGSIEPNNGELNVGPLRDGGYCDGPFISWKESILSLYSYYLNKTRNILPFNDLVNKCRDYLKTKIQIAICETPVFLHKNIYEKSNILIYKNHISGILDFEWAEAADNEYEITQIRLMINDLNLNKDKSSIWNTFLSNYKVPLSPYFNEKEAFYTFLDIIHFMNVWDFIKHKFSQKEQIQLIEKTRQIILDKV